MQPPHNDTRTKVNQYSCLLCDRSASLAVKLTEVFGSSPDLSSAVKERNRCRLLLIIIICMNLNQQINFPLWLRGFVPSSLPGRKKKTGKKENDVWKKREAGAGGSVTNRHYCY